MSFEQPTTSDTMSKLSVISPKGFRAILSSSRPGSRVIPVDATWYMPNSPFNGKKKFLEEERLKNAAFFDLDSIALQGSKYPHMLPPYNLFHTSLQKLGITNTDKLVVYDKDGIFSSPRVAWNLTLFGHKNVYLLDNYAKYNQSQYPLDSRVVETEATTSPDVEYQPILNEEAQNAYNSQVIEFEELLDLVSLGQLAEDYVTFDARSTGRFTGEDPEPRAGLSSGHIPSALSLPFKNLLNPDNTYKSRDEIIEIFQKEYGLDLKSKDTFPKEKGIIVMCGTGVTAVIIRVAIESIIGSDIPIRVYDGSWTEWAQRAPSQYIIKDV